MPGARRHLHERIGRLAAAGRIVKTADGYRLAEP
jgi:hypothetical protein